ARPLGVDGASLRPVAEAALALGDAGRHAARIFFESWFDPLEVVPASGGGFVTGYYEPEVDGAVTRSPAFPGPLHAPPADLVEIADTDDRSNLDLALTWARRHPGGGLSEHPDRAAIMAGALGPDAPAVAFVRDWIEAFFIHVQGSARIRLAGGGVRRVTFAAKSGHPYFAVARVLVERGLMTAAQATADVLRSYLEQHPEDVAAILLRNRSYIFFREAPVSDSALGPVAAAGVALTPGRSLAVDRHLHTFHLPVFVSADLGDPEPFRRLMIAQDTGSAIVGPARGDLFCGSGDDAWRRAARIRHPASFILLRPRSHPRGA
ncbi:MAG TPA: MltA domain-containing protein, partial [Methylomirabilota bacterium]|nr:MltA domain-containing protein [Methylomirabilota bacterium]